MKQSCIIGKKLPHKPPEVSWKRFIQPFVFQMARNVSSLNIPGVDNIFEQQPLTTKKSKFWKSTPQEEGPPHCPRASFQLEGKPCAMGEVSPSVLYLLPTMDRILIPVQLPFNGLDAFFAPKWAKVWRNALMIDRPAQF